VARRNRNHRRRRVKAKRVSDEALLAESSLQSIENKSLLQSSKSGESPTDNCHTKRCSSSTRKKSSGSAVEDSTRLTEPQIIDFSSTASTIFNIIGKSKTQTKKPTNETTDNAMVSGLLSDSPQHSARTWFENLESGEDRAAATAITDAAFIEMFLDIACKSELHEVEEIQRVSYSISNLAQGNSRTSEESSSSLLQDQKILSNGCDTHTSLADKRTYDADRVPRMVVNAYSNVYNSTIDAKISKDEVVEETPPVEEIPSTAFIIRPNNDHDEEKCELADEIQDEPLRTTLHFNSGLRLPVSSTSELNKIALASSAKILTSNTREFKSKASPVIPEREGEPGKSSVGSDDVHQKLNFSALSIGTKPLSQSCASLSGGTSVDKKQKHKERISRSKLSASRAMQSTLLASDKETANVGSKLLQHVRLVFTSALSVVKHTLIEGVNSDKEGIEVLTLDPCYLQNKSEGGLNFFDDAQCIIDSQNVESEFLGRSADGSNTGNFLDNGDLIRQNDDGTKVSWPEWLLPVTESKDPSTHLLLILLAKIELSIQDSYKQYIKTCKVGNGANDLLTSSCSPGTQNSFRPLLPSALKKKTDIACDLFFHDDECPPNEAGDTGPSNPVQETLKKTSSLDLIYRQKLRSLFTSSHKSSPSVGEHFQNILKTWAHLNSEKDFTRSMNASIKELFGKNRLVDGNDFQAEDLVLMPLSFVVSSASTRAHEWRHNIQKLATKWNEIILSGLGHVQQEFLSAGKGDVVSDHTEETKTTDSVDNILDDDAAILFKIESTGSSGKKKKKKKRRRKRKQANSRSAANACQGNSTVVSEANVASEQNNAIKDVCEIGNTVNSITQEVSNEVMLPQTPIVTKTTNITKPNTEETKSDAICSSSNRDVATLNTDITVSLVNGVNGTCVVGGGRLEDDENENSDAWETVEPKGGRGNIRNKKSSSDIPTVNYQPIGNGRKNKTKTKGSFRQRTSQRRKGKDVLKEIPKDNVKDIVHSILESVDEEIERGLKVTNGQRKERSARHNCDKLIKQGAPPSSFGKGMSPGRNARAASLRDVVMGHIASNPPFRIPSSQLPKASSDPVSSSTTSSKIKLTHRSISNDIQEESDSNLKTQKPKSMPSADQNTASTVPETLSGLSAATPSTSNTNEHEIQTVGRDTSGIKGQSKSKDKLLENIRTSNGGCNDSTISIDGGKRIGMSESEAIKSAAPLLQTVIGPRDVDSAKSSVASSLEATREDDVGYHLLRSCEKLSDDMVTFMDRRALALSTKRCERNLLLAALQETLQNIWAGKCRPEMYGSCATKLDLPSSDLDVVIREIDLDKENSFLRKCQSTESSNEAYVAEMNANVMDEALDTTASCIQKPYNVSYSNCYQGHHQFYPPLSKNGMRVIRLAAELENQPWAVQVKAIPTASVPLLKILADPSRLPGARAGMDWIVHQHMAAAVAAEINSTKGSKTPTSDNEEFCSPPASHLAAMAGISSPPYHTAPTPWRGADVMNGLLSLDITFEGSEHGGLGSTEYTNRVVNESCRETGLPPESTPAVQVLVVIKELLAQRRLNEPFSGGLSSYAILLLVVAVMKERRIIKEEMERVERQRRAVASEASVPEIPPHSNQTKNSNVVWPTPKQQSSLNSDSPKDNGPIKGKKATGWDQGKAQLTRKSSWAAIAKKSVTSHNTTQRISIPKNDSNKDDRKSATVPMGVDFCSAVTEGIVSSTVDTKQECVPPRPAAEVADKPTNVNDSPLFPQGSNDVLEVLCSGEPTAGKLLMHFLLFYGRHFDSQTTCIDVGARHYSDLREKDSKSPFLPREAGGIYNPVTEVYTVDPVVVYDPWEESDLNMNVARSCYAWSNIRCVFEQCFDTLSGVVERGNGTGASDRSGSRNSGVDHSICPIKVSHGGGLPAVASVPNKGMLQRQYTDDVSPLLELLLSF